MMVNGQILSIGSFIEVAEYLQPIRCKMVKAINPESIYVSGNTRYEKYTIPDIVLRSCCALINQDIVYKGNIFTIINKVAGGKKIVVISADGQYKKLSIKQINEKAILL